MYYGKVTDELEKLYVQYYEKFGVEPWGYEELEYGADKSSYKEFVRDIKKAIELNIDLVELVIGEYDDDCDY